MGKRGRGRGAHRRSAPTPRTVHRQKVAEARAVLDEEVATAWARRHAKEGGEEKQAGITNTYATATTALRLDRPTVPPLNLAQITPVGLDSDSDFGTEGEAPAPLAGTLSDSDAEEAPAVSLPRVAASRPRSARQPAGREASEAAAVRWQLPEHWTTDDVTTLARYEAFIDETTAACARGTPVATEPASATSTLAHPVPEPLCAPQRVLVLHGRSPLAPLYHLGVVLHLIETNLLRYVRMVWAEGLAVPLAIVLRGLWSQLVPLDPREPPPTADALLNTLVRPIARLVEQPVGRWARFFPRLLNEALATAEQRAWVPARAMSHPEHWPLWYWVMPRALLDDRCERFVLAAEDFGDGTGATAALVRLWTYAADVREGSPAAAEALYEDLQDRVREGPSSWGLLLNTLIQLRWSHFRDEEIQVCLSYADPQPYAVPRAEDELVPISGLATSFPEFLTLLWRLRHAQLGTRHQLHTSTVIYPILLAVASEAVHIDQRRLQRELPTVGLFRHEVVAGVRQELHRDRRLVNPGQVDSAVNWGFSVAWLVERALGHAGDNWARYYNHHECVRTEAIAVRPLYTHGTRDPRTQPHTVLTWDAHDDLSYAERLPPPPARQVYRRPRKGWLTRALQRCGCSTEGEEDREWAEAMGEAPLWSGVHRAPAEEEVLLGPVGAEEGLP